MMKFSVEDTVRVVSANNLFWSYTGMVVATYDSDLMSGERHYQVDLVVHSSLVLASDAPQSSAFTLRALFKEHELAYAA